MKNAVGVSTFILLGCLLGSVVTATYLGSLRNEDSHYGVRLSEKCIPEDGVALKFDYKGRGTAYITVLPPEPEATAPEKEKKK